MSKSPQEELRLLETLVGQTLSSVEFVQDYVQLRFDGPTLTAYTQPSVTHAGVTLRWNGQGYRDALCNQIGSHVAAVALGKDSLLVLEFDNQAAVSVSLKDEDYRGAEAVMFRSGGGDTFVI